MIPVGTIAFIVVSSPKNLDTLKIIKAIMKKNRPNCSYKLNLFITNCFRMSNSKPIATDNILTKVLKSVTE